MTNPSMNPFKYWLLWLGSWFFLLKVVMHHWLGDTFRWYRKWWGGTWCYWSTWWAPANRAKYVRWQRTPGKYNPAEDKWIWGVDKTAMVGDSIIQLTEVYPPVEGHQ